MNIVKYGLVALMAILASCGSSNTTEGPKTIPTVNVKVTKLNGEPVAGVYVQVGDATGNTNTSGVVSFSNVSSPYTVSAVPSATVAPPVSFKGVTRADPSIVLDVSTPSSNCGNTQEGLIRFRLPTGKTVDGTPTNKALGYVYFIAEGRRAEALHEDGLKANAAQVLKPGQRSGYIRVRFSQNSCAAQVTGSLLYLERQESGYTASGILKNVIAKPGVTTPGSGEGPYEIPVANLGSKPLAGQVNLPAGYTSGFVFAVAEIGGGAVIVSDPRDVKTIDPSATGRAFNLNLPGEIGNSNLKYRVGVLALSATKIAWLFSDNLYPLPVGGLNNLSLTMPGDLQPQSPLSNIAVTDATKITTTFDWTDLSINDSSTTDANLYHPVLSKAGGPNCPELATSDVLWTAVSASKTSNAERSQFALPVLPTPARLVAGAPANPCKFNWSVINAAFVRQASSTAPTADAVDTALDSDKLLDGRLVLKRHYSTSTSLTNTFFGTVAVWVRNTSTPTEAEIMTRDEIMWGASQLVIPAQQLAQIGTSEASIPNNLDLSALNSTAEAGVPVSADPSLQVNPADQSLLNSSYSNQFVGPFNNPAEIKAGVSAVDASTFSVRTQ